MSSSCAKYLFFRNLLISRFIIIKLKDVFDTIIRVLRIVVVFQRDIVDRNMTLFINLLMHNIDDCSIRE